MELILMLVVGLPLGFLVPNRTTAFVAYIALHGFVFTFQTLELVLSWAGGDTSAFGPFPDAEQGQVWAYGAVNLVIAAGGLGLVALGGHLARRRRNRVTVDLESGRV